MKSFDQMMNIVVDECTERIYSEDQEIIEHKLGLFLIRGENICMIGEIDPELEQTIDYANVKAAPFNPIHTS